MRSFVTGEVDLVRSDPECQTSLELHLRYPFFSDESSVLAIVRKEILITYPENARVEPAYGRIGQKEIRFLASPDFDLFQSETNFDAHPARDRNGKYRRVFCRNHREPLFVFLYM
jgi:hypothetical protein